MDIFHIYKPKDLFKSIRTFLSETNSTNLLKNTLKMLDPEVEEKFYTNKKNIDGLEFTRREIDIISCIINGRVSNKEIAKVLDISFRTVEANKNNINRKLRAVTNLTVRDFIEKSSKYQIVKQHYYYLSKDNNFSETYNSNENFKPENNDYNRAHTLIKDKVKNRSKFWVLLIPIAVAIVLYFNLDCFKDHHPQITSDLIIPPDNFLLQRNSLTNKINNNLKANNADIHITAIVGIGGAGKTTLARIYAKYIKNIPIIWEINAETKETCLKSIIELAYLLADSVEKKKYLKEVEQISDVGIKNKQYLNFVKSSLREKSNWLLIYDNLENFSEINEFFPHDPNNWGKGEIIITTRNENIAKTGHLTEENIINIGELSEEEKLTLFSKIYWQKKTDKLSETEFQKTIRSLKNLPPFPLDVFVAAYFLRSTEIDFDEYLINIKTSENTYKKIGQELLKEVTDYSQTRHGIISSCLKKLSDNNQDFKDLLTFIAFLDSQNITYELLSKYKSYSTVSDFIYKLAKDGLVTKNSKAISIHRSTHNIMLEFVRTNFSQSEKKEFLANNFHIIEDSYESMIKGKDYHAMLFLLPHVKSYLKALDIIDISSKIKSRYESDLYDMLGYIKWKTEGNFLEAKNYFQIALDKNQISNHLSQKRLAILYNNLSETLSDTGFLQEAIEYSKKSLTYCNFPGAELLKTNNLISIGSNYGSLCDINKSISYLQNSLEEAKKLSEAESKHLIIEIYTQLSYVYLLNYINKTEAKMAVIYDNKAMELANTLRLFKTNDKIPDSVTCDSARLQWRHAKLMHTVFADFENSFKWLESAEAIMKYKCPENLYLKDRIYGLMGESLLRRNMLLEAKDKFDSAITSLDLLIGPTPNNGNRCMRAEINIRLGNFEAAYNDSISLVKQHIVMGNNLEVLRYNIAYYNAALALHKLGRHIESADLFKNFMYKMDIFCMKFFTEKEYNSLKEQKLFADSTIENYLKNSEIIFAKIFGYDHSFIKNYVSQNTLK